MKAYYNTLEAMLMTSFLYYISNYSSGTWYGLITVNSSYRSYRKYSPKVRLGQRKGNGNWNGHSHEVCKSLNVALYVLRKSVHFSAADSSIHHSDAVHQCGIFQRPEQFEIWLPQGIHYTIDSVITKQLT